MKRKTEFRVSNNIFFHVSLAFDFNSNLAFKFHRLRNIFCAWEKQNLFSRVENLWMRSSVFGVKDRVAESRSYVCTRLQFSLVVFSLFQFLPFNARAFRTFSFSQHRFFFSSYYIYIYIYARNERQFVTKLTNGLGFLFFHLFIFFISTSVCRLSLWDTFEKLYHSQQNFRLRGKSNVHIK